MGDHRANVKIEFEFHGKTYRSDMWINYFPDASGLDQRIVEFFEEAYEDGIARFNAEAYKRELASRVTAQEERDRAEWERLNAKFGRLIEKVGVE